MPSIGVMKYFDKMNTGLLSTRKTSAVSPHAIMGNFYFFILFNPNIEGADCALTFSDCS